MLAPPARDSAIDSSRTRPNPTDAANRRRFLPWRSRGGHPARNRLPRNRPWLYRVTDEAEAAVPPRNLLRLCPQTDVPVGGSGRRRAPICGTPHRRGCAPSCDDCGYYLLARRRVHAGRRPARRERADDAAAGSRGPAGPASARPLRVREPGERTARGDPAIAVWITATASPPTPVVILRQEAPSGGDDRSRARRGIRSASPETTTRSCPASTTSSPWPSPASPRSSPPSRPGRASPGSRNLLDTLRASRPAGRPRSLHRGRFRVSGARRCRRASRSGTPGTIPKPTPTKRFGYLLPRSPRLCTACTSAAPSWRGCGPTSSWSPRTARRASPTWAICCRCRCRPTLPFRGTPLHRPGAASGSGKADARADLYSLRRHALRPARRPRSQRDRLRSARRAQAVHPALSRHSSGVRPADDQDLPPASRRPLPHRRGAREDRHRLHGADPHPEVARPHARQCAAWRSRPGRRPAWSAPATRTPSPCCTPSNRGQDDLGESALVLLCDGMGGYEAGEVAAALAIQATAAKPAAAEAVRAAWPARSSSPSTRGPQPDPKAMPAPADTSRRSRRLLKTALKDANKQVFTASRARHRPARHGLHRRGRLRRRPATSSSATSAIAGPIICTKAG